MATENFHVTGLPDWQHVYQHILFLSPGEMECLDNDKIYDFSLTMQRKKV